MEDYLSVQDIMSNFATMLKDENNKAKTLTENLGVAYETSGKYLLDFNFKLSQYRNMNVEDIKNDFAKVFFPKPRWQSSLAVSSRPSC